jgi:acetoin utilization deacetylase AcuC-like enzyme
MTVGIITHHECLLHDAGPHHPECPARLGAIDDQLIASGLNMFMRHFDAPAASREQLERVHEPAYVDGVFEAAPEQGIVHLDGDTAMCPGTLKAALRAAGAAVEAVDLVMAGDLQIAFCSVRPPGHHAERARAMGFCFFNNVAVGAAHALERHGLERVAILDFDVHHGNGTEDIFRGDPRVLFCSTFQHPLYPHTGEHPSGPNVINVPLSAGTTGPVFHQAVYENWLPALEDFKPQLILVSAGFDAHLEDDMAGLALREDDYRWVSDRIREMANRHAQGRVVSVLEGGYELHALGRSVAAHIDALIG